MTRTTDPRLSIRAATRVDVPTLVGLMSEFYAEAGFSLATDPAANAFSTLLTTPVLGRVWLAEVDGRGVGHLVLTIAFSMEFGGLHNVPRKAITLGVAPILNARRIVLLAWGERKASVIKNAVEGPVTELNPASYLQAHTDVTFVVDESAASELTRIKTPWAVDSVVWDNKMIKKAVTHLSQTLKKPILKLTDKDYNDNGMSDLLAQYGACYEININVFNQLQHTITGWPGGKPNADDTHRPERAQPAKKRVLIFSPHPDDDIISMGGTFQRLVDHQKRVEEEQRQREKEQHYQRMLEQKEAELKEKERVFRAQQVSKKIKFF